MKWLVRVDTRSGKISRTEATSEEMRWGGRMFIAKVLSREVPPICDPLGRNNKLIFAVGLLGDTPITTSGKLSVGAKSPLTHGVKEANTGGEAGKLLARCGIKALIFEDAPDKPMPRVLKLTATGAELIDAPELARKLVSETFSLLRKQYGPRAGLLCIGPAGEMTMAGAGVSVTDANDVQVRYAARGGLGAVMGSKGVKAIVVDDSGAEPATCMDPAAMKDAAREFAQVLLADPKTDNRHTFGTPAILALANELGLLPTRNFSSGSFEGAEALCGETVAKVIAERGGEGRSGVRCLRGCIIQCSNIFPNPSGKKSVASIQYENIALLGSNCGIGDLDDIAELNHLCNEVGVDTIEAGAALGVAMEGGVIPFGDAEGAKDLLRQIGQGTYLGRVLGNGSVMTGKILGVRRVPAVKGQAIPGYDPRALKGNGVTYVTSAMGADHTAGNGFETVRTIPPTGREGHIKSSLRLQIRAAILDSLGVCLFVRPAFIKKPEFFSRFFAARYGWKVSVDDVIRMGFDVLKTEQEFNRKAGVSAEFFDVPEFMRTEPLPPKNALFDIPLDEMQSLWTQEIPENVF